MGDITIKTSAYWRHAPHSPQLAFLACDHILEVLFGGAAGPGKSEAILMAALQYVDQPDYAAIIFRRTYSDLALAGGLIPRSHEYLAGTDAKWNDTTKTWTFPSGATVSFGYLASPADKFRYQGSEYQFIGFDELTQFREEDYLYLLSRLRSKNTSVVPERVRATSNPGGRGHEWVKRRFVNPETRQDRAFIPARLDDNPSLNVEAYKATLERLPPVERAQLLLGDWEAVTMGGKFERDWFYRHGIVSRDQVPWRDLVCVRYWDLAATEPSNTSKDPDYTAGCLYGWSKRERLFYLIDVRRFRLNPGRVENAILTAAQQDASTCPKYLIRMEQEPGASGKHVISHYATILRAYDFRGHRPTGSKEVRANPVAAAAFNGTIRIVAGAWHDEFFQEAELFPHSPHKDQVDALSGAHAILADKPRAGSKTYLPGTQKVTVIDGDIVLHGAHYLDKE